MTLVCDRGRPCSFSADNGLLYVGDFSSTVKVFDLRRAWDAGGSSPLQTIPPAVNIPNAPAFCGDACPIAAMHRIPSYGGGGGGGFLVSSSIGWWTSNRAAIEEAPEDEDDPVACLNVHKIGVGGGDKPTTGGSGTLGPDAHR